MAPARSDAPYPATACGPVTAYEFSAASLPRAKSVLIGSLLNVGQRLIRFVVISR